MAALYRAQLLLEPEQHQALAEIARREGRSISDLVRDIVRQHLAEREEEDQQARALQALKDLAQTCTRLREEHGVYDGDLVAEVRAEREEELQGAWGDGL
jgi:hypothetical protein